MSHSVGDAFDQRAAFSSTTAAVLLAVLSVTAGSADVISFLRGSTVHDMLRAPTCPLVVIHSAVRPLADATLSPALQD
jgi:hypothetical protein